MAWARLDDSFHDHPKVDDPTALYRLIGEAGRLLYVGIGRHPFVRLEYHVKHKSWWPEVNHSRIEWYATRTEALDAEVYAIRVEKPAYNVQGIGGKHSRRATPTQPPTPAVAVQTFTRLVGV